MWEVFSWIGEHEESVRGWLAVVGGLAAGIWALWQYGKSRRKDQAEWLSQLFDAFYRDAATMPTRILLDHEYSTRLRPILETLLTDENVTYSDVQCGTLASVDVLLNYLEFILHLESKGQLDPVSRMAMFGYWFELLKKPEYAALRLYLVRFGYEALSKQVYPKIATPKFIEAIAFYGTLCHGAGKQGILGVENYMRKVGECQIKGLKLDFGEYPGLIPGSEKIPGELYEVVDERVFAKLDEYEAFFPARPQESEFHRRYVRLAEPTRDAWVYFYNEKFGERAS